LQTGFDILLERFGDGLVEVTENLHGKLGVDALVTNEIIKSVCQSEADARWTMLVKLSQSSVWRIRSTCYGGKAHRKTAPR